MARKQKRLAPEPRLIITTAELEDVVGRLILEPYVTVDTEFLREHTYWPQLCLVQLAGQEEVVLIDAEAPGIDLSPLVKLFDAPDVVKVFHAARQDLEIFLHLFDRLPAPIFDTQVAAMVAGYGDQVGYDNLVGAITGAVIDKSHRFTDWSYRPLSEAQLVYAAADVTHLRDVYEELRSQLEKEGRTAWVAAEQEALSDPDRLRVDPERQWERIRARTSNRRMLGVLRAVAAWREREAQNSNIPRQRMLKDESVLEIAATQPKTIADLARVRGVPRGFAEGKHGNALLAVIAAARALPDAELPVAAKARPADAARPSSAMVALLKVLLATKCEACNVAPRLVASAEDIDRFALDASPDLPLLQGWRREVFGKDALALRNGEVALAVRDDRIVLLPV
ncbi:MAG: ribonuclease D [Acetobacter sp.]|jgi:ribonuclease D|nr:ribonuclease D [Acetobacter sp.]MCH4062186.1 ribonuclease D [Acetobacter sp.]MCH4088967.1 ribonuclease D [Acetobacter sp.]MCI1294544.1 ribonuclease D [Acetobacter sp.]MCI1321269.1 ribonuclease D [Acetobacter sp.]